MKKILGMLMIILASAVLFTSNGFCKVNIIGDGGGDDGLVNLGWYDITNYGAKGDGLTDDQPAIQTTIDAVPAAGGVVFLPPGTYKITSQININKSNITFLGSGYDATTIFKDDDTPENNTRIISISNDTGTISTVENVMIKGMRITSTGQSTENSAGRGAIMLDSGDAGRIGSVHAVVSNCKVIDCMIDGVPISGISINGGIQNTVEGCIIRGVAEHGLYISGAASPADMNSIQNNTIYNVSLNASNTAPRQGVNTPTCAIKVSHGATHTAAANNQIYNFGYYGVIIEDGSTENTASSNTITLGYENNFAIRLSSNGNEAFGNLIDLKSGFTNAKAFVIDKGASENLIANNSIIGTAACEVIDIRDGVSNVSVIGNTIASGPADGWAIYMPASGNNPSAIKPNIAFNTVVSDGYGIELGNSDGAIVVDNSLSLPAANQCDAGHATNVIQRPFICSKDNSGAANAGNKGASLSQE